MEGEGHSFARDAIKAQGIIRFRMAPTIVTLVRIPIVSSAKMQYQHAVRATLERGTISKRRLLLEGVANARMDIMLGPRQAAHAYYNAKT